MAYADGQSPHTFHIPVMGTGFMIDAPLRVAKYGISSAISLVDDVLIEQMRRFHCEREGEPYEKIPASDVDARARRITAYLNLLDRLVGRQVVRLQAAPFEAGSEVTRYFEMLPDGPLARTYREMQATADPRQCVELQNQLRRMAVPGSINVNIMSKGDRDLYRDGEKLPAKYSDASAALRGFANSTLSSSIIFSAGISPRLYGYVAEFDDFFPNERGELKKKIVLKVSDYHSAAVQGKFFAKHGLWVSEYRIESGLNCGGHTFATKGLLLGPILEEFQRKKRELVEQLHAAYVKALKRRGYAVDQSPREVRVTVQGGIGDAVEDALLREHYGADGTGWATPFLLVPEVSNVDDEHLRKLAAATGEDVFLSDSSPFGIPFWNLRNSASEEARRRRIGEGRPGSPCSKGFVQLFNVEFTPLPICTASREYQRLKLEQLERDDLTDRQREAARRSVLAKSCICHDLAGVATLKNGIDRKATPAVCCGPNIVNFSKVATLEEMVGHIYGRVSLVTNPARPQMFIRELAIYIDYLLDELEKRRLGFPSHSIEYFQEFRKNLRDGIDHYRRLADRFEAEERARFLDELERLREMLDAVPLNEDHVDAAVRPVQAEVPVSR
ncbi:MAG: hypothetical protein KKE86_05855 [Planctomycetes bacterium]|nr:hypothetical protein [Planctomycetota bacterium]MBU4398846.1 hypothetical protein [Planctomycetota bacterium]MCG2682393.1 hypothetical protein [Planctomycetales bacterium]